MKQLIEEQKNKQVDEISSKKGSKSNRYHEERLQENKSGHWS